MKNTIDYSSLTVHPEVFSLDKFIASDAPGTLSWLNMETDEVDNDNLPIKEIEFNSITPTYESIELNKQLIPCQRQCAGCRRWQIESSGKMDLSDTSNPETK